MKARKKIIIPDPELETLKAELDTAKADLQAAYCQFDLAVEPELVESCVYQISAVQARCNYLIRAIKARHPAAAAAAAPAGGRHMDLNQKILSVLLAGFLLVALVRVFSVPLKLTMKLLVNTLLGFAALWLVNRTAALTGVSLGLNLWNALTIGVLGLPGFVLLLLVQWVL